MQRGEKAMLTVAPLSKPFVGEVKDLDLRKPIGDALFQEILDAWAKHPVLVFRDQELDLETQQAFSERFGPLMARARPAEARGKGAQGNPYLMLVSNVRDENGKLIGSSADGPLTFHSDGCFNEVPPKASLLYGIDIPSVGGDTLFVSMYQVYDALRPETRERLQGKQAVNYHSYDSNGAESGLTKEQRGTAVRNSTHPMVIRHPVTQKPAVFANRHMTREVVGMEPGEARALLDEIFDVVERPEFIYAHKWRKGDLVIWDNRAVQHGRSDFSPQERRMLRRFAVLGEAKPQAYA
jgi:taurine dioxygenase